MDREKSSGIIAQLALPSQRQGRPIRKQTKVLTEEEKERKKNNMHLVLNSLFYNELRVCPDEGNLLLTEQIFTDSKTRAEMASLLFDEYEVKALMFVPQEFLALIANGQETGIVINMGHTHTNIVPIWKLNILRDKAVMLPVGGQDVTRALELFLKHTRADQVYSICDFDQLVVEDIKESKGYVAVDYEAEMRKPEKLTEFELPDYQVVNLGRELFRCTECFFQPHLFGIQNTKGLIESVNGVIDSLEVGIRREIADQSASIFLAGSSSRFPGLVERLQAGVEKEHCPMKVRAAPERHMSSWIGGSIWAKLGQNKNSWTTKEEYDEFGPSVVHSKCI
ncbi:hypothetical protein ACHWQZ_G003020 [Mnemiopsis leidyi]